MTHCGAPSCGNIPMSHMFGPDYIRAIAPYQGGKPISEVAREFGLDENKIVKLASNQNPHAMPESAHLAMTSVAAAGRDPNGNGIDLNAALTVKYGVPAEWITLGKCSKHILQLAVRAFVQFGQSGVYAGLSFAV